MPLASGSPIGWQEPPLEDDDSTNEDYNSQREDSEDYDSQDDELQTAEEYDERFDTININNNENLAEKQHNSAEKQSKTNQPTGESTTKTAEKKKNEQSEGAKLKTRQSIEARIKIENTEEQLEDTKEKYICQPSTSQEDIKNEIKEEIAEENTSRQTNTTRNAEEQIKLANRPKMDNQPIKEEIGENAEKSAEKRDKLPKEEKLRQSDEDNIEERIAEMEREISDKISVIKREEVGEPFIEKDVSFIHIKRIQEIINRRFNGDNVNNDNQQRENANKNLEDNDSSDGHSRNDENDNNQPEENENYNSDGERTIVSSGGSSRSYNSELEEELFMDMRDPSKIVFSEQERLNIMSYNVKFRSNPGHWICEPINGEIEVAASDGCEATLTRVRDTLRDERHNGRFDRAAVVNGHSLAQVGRAKVIHSQVREINDKMDRDKTDRNKIDREQKRLDRWEENLQKKVRGYTQQKKMLDVRRNRLKAMDDFERELSAVESDDKEYDREEIAAQRRSLSIMKQCEEARGRNVFDVGKYRVNDSEGNPVADVKAIYVIRDLRHQSDVRSFSYEIKTTIIRGTAETTIRAREEATTKFKPIEEAKETKQPSETPMQKTMILPQQSLIPQQLQQQELPQLIPMAYQQTGGGKKRKKGSETKGKDSAKKPNKPMVKSSIQLKPPTKKQKTRKSAEKARIKIKQTSKEDEHSSGFDDKQQLPTRVDQIKKSVSSKILIKDLPRRMKSMAAPPIPESTPERSGGECQPITAAQASEVARGMAEPSTEPGEPANQGVENIEGAEDCSFKSVASTQILSPIEDIISIRFGQGQPSETQPAGHGEAQEQGHPTAQPAGIGEARRQGEAGQPGDTEDDAVNFGHMSQKQATDQ
ncbi:general transcriptional corepressor trfA-like [Temnothorax curvispinosus]|uniref:General transcriptional corepressor trfA-like n=1 Tax=Temnothorax curvispinosus TaxID=300111 RepID=A0A6J1QA31_9HYME|nr:general transcriptional corepressor trfA-like [Temnothorax curvispinosus]